MILKFPCSICKTEQKVKSTAKLGERTIIRLNCGHTIFKEQVKEQADYSTIESIDGKRLFQFQADGCRSIEKADGQALVSFEMGLGKTPTVVAFLTLHDESRPAVIVCRSSLKRQIFRETVRWSNGKLIPQVIDSSKEKPNTLFPVMIISMDLLCRLPDDYFTEYNPVTIIIDETQGIKNHDAQRTNAVRKFFKECKYRIGLSGTPIKNNAVEFFPILNLLKPERFTGFNSFVNRYVDYYSNGYSYKYGGIRDRERWNRDTQDFVIRRTREEVAPELPRVFRKFLYVDLLENLKKEYDEVSSDFTEYYYAHEESNSLEVYSNILAYFSKMRHITGLSKIQNTLEFVEEFLLTEDRKLTVFVHHKDVGSIIYARIAGLCKLGGFPEPIKLTAEMNSLDRDEAVLKFTKGDARILIASTLASSEGLNLQECSDCIFVERQWNAVNEEQAESRFVRFGTTASQVNATYIIAVSTIDEYFTELVERKRSIVAQSLDGKGVEETNQGERKVIMELAEVLAQKGRESWSSNFKKRR